MTAVVSAAQNQACIKLSLFPDLIMLFQDDKIKQGEEAQRCTREADILDRT